MSSPNPVVDSLSRRITRPSSSHLSQIKALHDLNSSIGGSSIFDNNVTTSNSINTTLQQQKSVVTEFSNNTTNSNISTNNSNSISGNTPLPPISSSASAYIPPPLTSSFTITPFMKEQARKKETLQISSSTGASFQEINEFREIFELVDADKGGSIDGDELRKLTSLLNMDITEEELENMMNEIDTTGKGEIFFPDFVRTMLRKPTINYTKNDVINAFHTLAGHKPISSSSSSSASSSSSSSKNDNNRTQHGYILQSVLCDQLMNVGYESEKLTKNQVEDIIGFSESYGGAQEFYYEEFVALMMGENRGGAVVDENEGGLKKKGEGSK